MAKASAAASAMVESEGGSVGGTTTTTTTTKQLTGVLLGLEYLNMMKMILYGAHSNVAMGFKKISYCAHSNVNGIGLLESDKDAERDRARGSSGTLQRFADERSTFRQ